MTIALPAFDTTAQRRSIEQICDDLALVALAALGVVAIFTFRDYGLGWDDYTHSEYADLLIAMFTSGFSDRRALSFANLYMYGGGFDVIAALLHKILPFGIFETRRLLGAIVGIIGITVTWRIARRVGGPVAGLAGLLILALCPVFYGHIFMNPKDAPFAVAMAVLTLSLVRLADEYPSPSPRTVLLVGFAAGLAISLRVLGGLGAIYALVGLTPLLIADIRQLGVRAALSRLGVLCYSLLPGLLFGYLVMGLVWPWSVLEPLNPLHAVTYFSEFFEKPWREMFNGAPVRVPDMPWTYLPILFSLKMPELMLGLFGIGAVGSLVILARSDVDARRKSVLLILTAAATLPIAVAMIKRPALYNGIRHFIFVIPPMAALAGVAAGWIYDRLSRRSFALTLAATGVFALGLASPLVEMIRLHPYQYASFNHIAGGVRGAENRFMLDYWGLSFKQASEALLAHLARTGEKPAEGRKWKVAACGPQRPPEVFLGPNFTIGWDSKDADFAMMLGVYYCRKLDAPVIADIQREGVNYARVYDIRGKDVGNLLSIPAP